MGFHPTQEKVFDTNLPSEVLKIYSPFVDGSGPIDPFSGNALLGDKIYFYNDASEKLVLTKPTAF